MQPIKSMFDFKSFIIFIIVTVTSGFIISKIFDLSFIIGCTITGGAILVNGIIIAVTSNKNEDNE